MDEEPNVTWPRSQSISKILFQNRSKNQIESYLYDLKKQSEKNNDPESLKIIDELTSILHKLKDDNIQSPPQTITGRTAQAMLMRSRRNTISRNEPYFGSMVTIHSSQPTERGGRFGERYLDGIRESQDFEIENGPIDNTVITDEDIDDSYPVWIDVLPLVLQTIVAILFIAGGGYVFQLLDPQLAEKPFYEVIFVPFMTCSTVGWGFVYPTYDASQIFTIFYGMIGVPLLYGVLANFGRILSQIYCYNFSFLIPFKDNKSLPSPDEAAQGSPSTKTLPVPAALNMVVVHSFIAVIVYTCYLDNLSVIESIYFNFIAISTVGFGDISPKPQSIFGATFIMIFVCFGLVITSCYLVTTTIRLEHFFFEYFPSVIAKFNMKEIIFDKLHSQNSSFNNSQRNSRKINNQNNSISNNTDIDNHNNDNIQIDNV